jgi:FkbM family methyltransferase
VLRLSARDVHPPPPSFVLEPLDMGKLRERGYASQFGQDVVLDAILRGLGVSRGFFVDVGAHDGTTGSNTVFFERGGGWEGICIEPLPGPFEKLKANRSALALNCAIGEREGNADFISVKGYAEMLSGLELELDRRHRARIEDEVARHGGNRETARVAVRRLDGILADHDVRRIDLLSVDVEGAELAVLRSFDFSAVAVLSLTIENNYDDDRVARYLGEVSGLRRVLRLGPDDIYLDASAVSELLSR